MTGFYRPGQRVEQRMRRFMSISGAGIAAAASTDPYFSSVVSLLHHDVAGTAWTDQKGKTWTRNGTATTQSVLFPKYGAAGMQVNANTADVGNTTNNGITTPSHADFNFGTADFTLEWWQNSTINTGFQNAFDRGGVTAGALLIQTGNGDNKFKTYIGGVAVMTESSGYAGGAWLHYALVKDAGTLRMYRAGVQTASVANATNITNTAVAAWGAYANGNNCFSGYMDDCRITKGVCRYPSGTTFTPPTAAFPDS